MSEFWLVVDKDGDTFASIWEDQAKETYDSWNENVASCRPYAILHFVNGIPTDVTPGREKAEFDLAAATHNGLDARLAKIEERLAAMESKGRVFGGADHFLNDMGKVDQVADASKTMSGAEAVYRAAWQGNPPREWSETPEHDRLDYAYAYAAAVAHYRKAHPHLTLDQIYHAVSGTPAWPILEALHDRIAASRKEAE